jgi:Mg-chelatase subunit ChlD
LEIAAQIRAPALVIDTENTSERLERSRQLAETLYAQYVHLESPELSNAIDLAALKPLAGATR